MTRDSARRRSEQLIGGLPCPRTPTGISGTQLLLLSGSKRFRCYPQVLIELVVLAGRLACSVQTIVSFHVFS